MFLVRLFNVLQYFICLVFWYICVVLRPCVGHTEPEAVSFHRLSVCCGHAWATFLCEVLWYTHNETYTYPLFLLKLVFVSSFTFGLTHRLTMVLQPPIPPPPPPPPLRSRAQEQPCALTREAAPPPPPRPQRCASTREAEPQCVEITQTKSASSASEELERSHLSRASAKTIPKKKYPPGLPPPKNVEAAKRLKLVQAAPAKAAAAHEDMWATLF